MNEKAAWILALAIVVATILFLYFSPYARCVRAHDILGEAAAHRHCASLKK